MKRMYGHTRTNMLDITVAWEGGRKLIAPPQLLLDPAACNGKGIVAVRPLPPPRPTPPPRPPAPYRPPRPVPPRPNPARPRPPPPPAPAPPYETTSSAPAAPTLLLPCVQQVVTGTTRIHFGVDSQDRIAVDTQIDVGGADYAAPLDPAAHEAVVLALDSLHAMLLERINSLMWLFEDSCLLRH